MNKKAHWENIYNTKERTEFSWYQEKPSTAIQYLVDMKVAQNARIIDVGGGDSFFVDYLLANGYENISVLDISESALYRAQQRLGSDAEKVDWIVADVSNFRSKTPYDFWYDRAAFHFLTLENEVKSYIENLNQNIAEGGQVVIGTFSENGPTKCSGIEIKQYSTSALREVVGRPFNCLSSQQVDHKTPFNTVQHFTFCSFKKE